MLSSPAIWRWKGRIEENMGEIQGSFQGGSIDVKPSQHAAEFAQGWRNRKQKP
jgi:hypothetical protein